MANGPTFAESPTPERRSGWHTVPRLRVGLPRRRRPNSHPPSPASSGRPLPEGEVEFASRRRLRRRRTWLRRGGRGASPVFDFHLWGGELHTAGLGARLFVFLVLLGPRDDRHEFAAAER